MRAFWQQLPKSGFGLISKSSIHVLISLIGTHCKKTALNCISKVCFFVELDANNSLRFYHFRNLQNTGIQFAYHAYGLEN